MNSSVSTETKLETQTAVKGNFKKIGIFFGDFNPIHNGQLIAAEQVIDRYQLDAIFFGLADRDFNHQRMQMLQLATNGNSKFNIAPKNYQDINQMIVDFTKIYPETERYLIVGANELLNNKNFQPTQKNINSIKIIGLTEPKVKKTKDFKVEWFKFDRLDINATKIRLKIKNYQTVRYLISDIVAAYIAEYNLYKQND